MKYSKDRESDKAFTCGQTLVFQSFSNFTIQFNDKPAAKASPMKQSSKPFTSVNLLLSAVI